MPDTSSPGRDERGRRHRRAADERAQPVRRVRPSTAHDGPLFAAQDKTVVGGTHRERAYRWMAEHPWAVPLFVDLALSRLKAGQTRLGAKAIWEQMRYHPRSQDTPLNNNWTTYVAEAAEAREPRLQGRFRRRRSKS